MDEHQQDDSEVLETTEETVEETPDEETIEESDETTEEETPETPSEADKLREELDAEKKKNAQLFERAKKAEAKKSAPSQDLSQKDLLYLAKADIADEDIEDVIEESRVKKISVAEAHKFLGPILKERAEERKTQAAMQTKSQRASSKTSDESVLEKARSNEVTSDADMQAIFRARQARKTSQYKK